jgi:CSLREA domain-containing protein
MHRKFWIFLLTALLSALVLTGGVLAVAAPMAKPVPRVPLAPADLAPTYWLTVTTTSDAGGSDPNSERCETHSPCTLRRAINEARWHSAADEVFHIAFAIPDTDPGYDAAHGVWIITVNSDNSGSETHAFRELGTYGQVIVDGTTQPGGRDLADGPRIILRGDNEKGAFTLTGGRNVIRGLAFQGFANNMITIPPRTKIW